jgi:16S rRNA (cytidine1402-2'-O)-methyltransferase
MSGPTVIFYESPHRIEITLEELQRGVGDVPVIVARELTKAHEELVRGPISTIVGRLSAIKGEFTVVVDIGHLPEHGAPTGFGAPSVEAVRSEFGLLTINKAQTRRQAISALSRRYGVSAKLIYAALEEAKKSGG